MRTPKLVVFALFAAAALAFAGCRGAACRSGTLLLSVNLDSKTMSADQLEVAVVLPGGTKHGAPFAHKRGQAQGTIEVDFKGAYPANQMATVTVQALAAGQIIGAGSQQAMLSGSCKALSLDVSAITGDGGVDGGTCTPASCPNGFCVDGVCCDSPCTGQCEACDVPGSVGKCTAVSGKPHGDRAACAGGGTACAGSCDGMNHTGCAYPDSSTSCGQQGCAGGIKTLAVSCDGAGNCPAPETLECTPAMCNTSNSDCAKTCGSDADCTAFAGKPHCDHGVCTAHLPLGGKCSSTSDCNSGNCVDGYCCDQACGGACQACDVSGHEGTCTPVTSGQPHGARGACSGSGKCAGACAPGQTQTCTFATGACAGGTCANGTDTPAVFCNNGSCPSVSASACAGNFACNSGGSDCLKGPCGGDSDCASGFYCAADGTCKAQQHKGDKCQLADCKGQSNCRVCDTGNCVDGYCCDQPCGGTCQACDVSGKEGSCQPVPSMGQPHGSRKPGGCGGSGNCAGYCDGSDTDRCFYPTVQCQPQRCAGGVVTFASSCVSGTCTAPVPATQNCSNGACANNTTCGGCTSDAQCGSGKYCDGGGNCQAQLGAGLKCTRAQMCSTSFCVDGYCCLTSCDGGPCLNCNANPGTCTPTGSAPSPLQPVTNAGTTRAACPGSGGCQEACNGSGAACADANGGKTCVAQSCSGGVETDAVQCSAGACGTAATKRCPPYACDAGGQFCLTKCTQDSDCVAGNYCDNNGHCVAQKTQGATCGLSGTSNADCWNGGNCSECATGNCVDGYCCDSACTGSCQTCNGSGVHATPGTCDTAKSGSPPHGGCTGSNFACNGFCDGSSNGCSWGTGTCHATNGCSGNCDLGSCVAGGSKCGTSCCPCGCTVVNGVTKCAICM